MSWKEIFDLFSSEYGWGTKKTLKLTLFELNWRLVEICKRLKLTRDFDMAIHGATPENKEQVEAVTSLSDNQKKALDIARKRAMERKKLEFKNRG